MIGKAIKEEHPHPRPLNVTVEHFFKGYPGFSDAAAEDRLRAPRTPPTCTACCTTRSSSCSSSRRAARAPRSSTRTATGSAASAAAASSRPRCARRRRSCPVCVVGAEEAAPVFAQVNLLAEAHRPHLLPDHADLPALRAARHARLPAGEVQDPLPRAHPLRRRGACTATSRSSRRSPTRCARGSRRASGTWSASASRCGSDDLDSASSSPASRPTGAAASPRRSSSDERDRGDHRRRQPRPDARARAHRVRARRRTSTRCCGGSWRPPRSTPSSTAGWCVDSTVTSPRKAHENNVIGTMNLLAACSGPDSTVRKFVFKSSAHYYGAEQDDPAFFTEAMGRPHPPRTPIERDIVEAEADGRPTSPRRTPTSPSRSCASRTCSGPTVRTSHSRLLLAARSCR